ncbi:beta-lactamase class A [Agromyces hippuratus]|uniref:Beta-lactamase n=1 Tax=Agromyces hippuratus TaxID=286438 RepID=A0A852WNZ1_9MICO|nr:class A beta-lactamase [Agromyces hippuratus]NYG19659.1 beta-lactamase class A [Agromyces hippuratus]
MINRPTSSQLSRRSLLAIGGLTTAGAAAAAFSATPAVAAPAAPAVGGHRRLTEAIAELERATSVTIGVTALWHDSRRAFRYRGDELFPMCSLFKTFAAGALVQARGYDDVYWAKPIPFTDADVVGKETRLNRMTWQATPEEMADAAIRYSDNTAGNLLLRELGGPQAVTAFARSLGATRTRLDRPEPQVNEATPGDERDTSTPDDIAFLLQLLLIDQGAGALTTARLQEWMLRNTTSGKRILAGLTPPFELADKTGLGGYGVVNDAGVVWRPGEEALTLAILTRTDRADAPSNHDVLGDVTRLIAAV